VKRCLHAPVALLGRRRSTSCRSNQGGTALLYAAGAGSVDVVRLLLARNGVEVNQTNANGCTALFLAAHFGHAEVVRLLLARPGVEVTITRGKA
jgi:ankyrin repeat protein